MTTDPPPLRWYPLAPNVVDEEYLRLRDRIWGLRAPLGFFPNPPFKRESQHLECDICGKTYWKHPIYPIFPWLNIICDGRLVKL